MVKDMYLVKRIYHFIVDPKIPSLASSLAFFVFLNGGSYLFLFVTLSSYLPLNIINIIENGLMDGDVKDLIMYLLNYNSNINYSLFLIITSLYSSSSLYYHYMNICEIFTKRISKASLGKRAKALITTPIILLSFILAIMGLVFINLIKLSIINIISKIVLVLIILLITYFLNFLALGDIKIKKNYKGVIFSFLYFLIFTILFIIYLNMFSNFKIVYGILSFFIILMFYIYILCIGLLLGVYINCKNLDVFHFLFNK